ncbi:hypothetical protein [Aquibium microcysteis]|uniref:hypothetical protein n=1 Tax=Aquibium microcysteis TaxID=675281 RepID=UPI00165D2E61|nr:hypothetical protein [Aquibium microcysteis]
MAPRESRKEDNAGRMIRRELHSKENARFLHSLPTFKLDGGLPKRLTSLLDDLRLAESSRGVGGNSSGLQRR